MSDYVLSIDPGLSTGIALLSYETDSVPVLEKTWQFSGGAENLADWLQRGGQLPLRLAGSSVYAMAGDINFKRIHVICEAFTARKTRGFSYTTASLEALPCIGVLVALNLVDRRDKKRYRDPKYQYLVGGKDLDDKKKRQHKFLEDSGYYIGRKEIGETLKDYNDARSATAHGLNYLARELNHKPTFDMMTEWSERNG